ncbi:MAG TPA: hypothetical protein VFP35_01035 [Candidatus Saccharimonadales bacterium]|nr:hypothetical protein [Candidatus Saccharimonadales bacterium]
MENLPEGDSALVEQVLVLPPAGELKAGFTSLDLFPSEINRLVPSLTELGGQSLSASDLTLAILDKIDAFAKGSASASDSHRQGFVIKREIARIPDFLGVFIADSEILESAKARLAEILASPEIAAELDHHSSAASPRNSTTDDLLRGAPRGVKKSIRKILNTPEDQRTSEQARQLEKLLRRLGRQGLDERSARRFNQPSQRELAKLQAERNHKNSHQQ